MSKNILRFLLRGCVSTLYFCTLSVQRSIMRVVLECPVSGGHRKKRLSRNTPLTDQNKKRVKSIIWPFTRFLTESLNCNPTQKKIFSDFQSLPSLTSSQLDACSPPVPQSPGMSYSRSSIEAVCAVALPARWQ